MQAYELGPPSGVAAADLNAAFRLYKQAAAGGIAAAHTAVGRCCRDGLGTTRNMTVAVASFNAAALSGDANARYALGVILLAGSGGGEASGGSYIEPDVFKAAMHLAAAAQAGHAGAQVAYADLLVEGSPGAVEADPAEALRWLQRAADGNDVDAALAVGLAHAGRGRPALAAAASEFRLGLADHTIVPGGAPAGGTVVSALALAIRYLRISAAAGVGAGMCGLARCLEAAATVAADVDESGLACAPCAPLLAEALEWYTRANEQVRGCRPAESVRHFACLSSDIASATGCAGRRGAVCTWTLLRVWPLRRHGPRGEPPVPPTVVCTWTCCLATTVAYPPHSSSCRLRYSGTSTPRPPRPRQLSASASSASGSRAAMSRPLRQML